MGSLEGDQVVSVFSAYCRNCPQGPAKARLDVHSLRGTPYASWQGSTLEEWDVWASLWYNEKPSIVGSLYGC